MGWCSATDIFDKVAKFVISAEADTEFKRETLMALIGALEEGDWDCQRDSAYWGDPLIESVFREMHPRWFED
jgi:hypothetical protein